MEKTKIVNPVILGDYPDTCVIYVDGAFYLTTTSMYFMPGIPVMRSYDLAHWETISYVYDTFQDNPAHNLKDGKNIYGQGSWATTLRYHNGFFYVCFNSNDTQSTFVYRTEDIEQGPWERSVLPGMHHDPSLLFDDDGRTYIVYGNGTIYIKELTEDAMAVKPGGVDQVLVATPKVEGLNCEGSHFHKINGKYYLMLIQWPPTGSGRRVQWCYRCDTLLGDYRGKVVLDDDMSYQNNGVAQGGLFAVEDNWYTLLFQDRSAFGRTPVLVPVQWEEDWPVLGVDGKVPQTFEVPLAPREQCSFTADDDFDDFSGKLSFIWQWNHNPDNENWSVDERPGYLRLRNGRITDSFLQARNTLTQHGLAPVSAFYTKLDCSGMRAGDCAGIAALQHRFGYIGVRMEEDKRVLVVRKGEGTQEEDAAVQEISSNIIYLKVRFDFTEGRDIASFLYSLDGSLWKVFGENLHMVYSLEHFTGYRPALFSFGTRETGGYADFDFFRVEME